MDGGEFLQGLYVPELGHCRFPSSERLVRVLGPVVEPAPGLLATLIADHLHRSSVGREPVRDDRRRPAITLLPAYVDAPCSASRNLNNSRHAVRYCRMSGLSSAACMRRGPFMRRQQSSDNLDYGGGMRRSPRVSGSMVIVPGSERLLASVAPQYAYPPFIRPDPSACVIRTSIPLTAGATFRGWGPSVWRRLSARPAVGHSPPGSKPAGSGRIVEARSCVQASLGPIQEKWRCPTPFALLLPRI